jgi:hypothetical protein
MKLSNIYDEPLIADGKPLNLFGASLAVLSCCIGGGVVGLPYSFY